MSYMEWLLLGWLLAFFAASISVGLIGRRIIDEVERDVPIQDRPSGWLWIIRRIPLAEVRQHRQMYPASSLRKWLAAMSVLQSGLLATLFLSAILRMVR